jgi:hypothetical protein
MDEAVRCARVGYLYLGHLLAVGTPDELKALPDVTPAGTRRLEIVPERAGGGEVAEALERLRHQPGVRQATIFGQSIHALVDADRSEHDLGLTRATVRPTEATLEDVFVALSRAQQNGG